MLRLASYDIVFQEIPGEVTLALNLAGCPNGCPGCHSPHLQQDTGEELDEALLAGLLDRYGTAVTCVCFMGGDGDPAEVQRLALLVQQWGGGETGKDTSGGKKLKTGWYSGRGTLPAGFDAGCTDYIKLGPYVERLGGLDSPTTNQRLYRVEGGGLTDITPLMRKGPA
ncbi:MAG: anaerobic ribonucleoside-triphosphate reductase activating protein [Rikenellaceae bacterium]|jgi:anaerobic ribonucleoside-triphosphate reductase activating protein|nr:anaerobic ribonucleoside-triphosphate reductase activating protein [Rikenellaceae bacterium]